jgi:hypothetical protein
MALNMVQRRKKKAVCTLTAAVAPTAAVGISRRALRK